MAGTLIKPFRQNVALAVDGGGIKGVMVARALMVLQEALGKPIGEVVRLAAGTSTGAIIAASLARGIDAQRIHELYVGLGPRIFPKSWRTLPLVHLLVNYQYSSDALIEQLRQYLGDITLGELARQRPDFHLVITATDIYAGSTRFIKLYKARYQDWRLRDTVMASSVIPTVFPVFEHRFATPTQPAPPDEAWIPEPRAWVDGGVGSYMNPCFLAAYEAAFCLRDQGWRIDNTTLISIGTGYSPPELAWRKRTNDFRRKPGNFYGPEWVFPTIDTFLQDANAQQVRMVRHFFHDAVVQETGNPAAGLDFRRFNLTFDEPIEPDSVDKIDQLSMYGERLGQMILRDEQEDVGGYSCGPQALGLSLSGG